MNRPDTPSSTSQESGSVPAEDSFGVWLRRRRRDRDWSQRALALAVNCSEDAIRKIELGERRPSRGLAGRLARELGVAEADVAAFAVAARAWRRPDAGSGAGSTASGESTQRTRPVAPGPSQDSAFNGPRAQGGGKPRTRFVGREDMLSELAVRARDIGADRCRFVLITGEPGIGKSRTTERFAESVETRGFRVAWGRCFEGGGASPYSPWRQIVRSLARSLDLDIRSATLTELGATLATIVPDIGPVDSGARRNDPDVEPAIAQFRLFDSVMRLIDAASRAAALIVIFDDLHWSDPTSLRLLEYVCAELPPRPVLFIGTSRKHELRPGHPLQRLMGTLVGRGLARSIPLDGLSPEEVAQFLETGATTPGALTSLAAAIHERTGGNPLFVTEMVRLLERDGLSAGAGFNPAAVALQMPIPDSVRETILARFAQLSRDSRELLQPASLLGRQFELDILPALGPVPDTARTIDALEDAIAAGLVEEGDIPGRFQFVHALIGESISASMSAVRRAHLHAALAAACEHRYAPDDPEAAPLIARHLEGAGPFGNPEKLAFWQVLAGEHALSVHAHDEALACFAAAVNARAPMIGDGTSARALFGLARAQLATLERHRFQEAVATLHRAFEVCVSIGDNAGAVAVADYGLPDFPGFDVAMASVMDQARRLVPPDSLAHARLLARHGIVTGMRDADLDSAMQSFDATLAVARARNDVALEKRTCANSSYVAFFHRRYDECIRLAGQALDLPQSGEDSLARLSAFYWMACAMRDTGDLDAMASATEAVLESSHYLAHRFWMAGAYWLKENGHRLHGQWDAARAASDQRLAVSPRDFRLLATRALLDYETGRFTSGRACLVALLDEMLNTPKGPAPEYSFAAMIVPLAALIAGREDMIAESEAAAASVLNARRATPIARLHCLVGLGASAILRRDVSDARRLYRALSAPRELQPPPGGIFMQRMLGCLARIAGNRNAALEHLEAACQSSQSRGYLPESAWSTFHHAEALRDGATQKQRRQSAALFAQAERLAAESGMVALLEQVKAVRA